MEEKSLIQVTQTPVIENQLLTLKERWDRLAQEAESMVCTEDTIQAVKAFRADMRKEFDEVEAQRKAAKEIVMAPYNQFEAIYKECVTDAFNHADAMCAQKISDVEADIKKRCEDGLRDYFSELCEAHHLDWLSYDRAGIKIDMASARAKTPKKLREEITAFVVGVSESVDRINFLEDAGEIMAEYQQTLDAAGAICAVKDRHRRIEEAKVFQEQRDTIRQREDEAVRKVEALAPPVQAEPPKTVKCTFTVRTTMEKLKKLKEFLIMEGIDYE